MLGGPVFSLCKLKLCKEFLWMNGLCNVSEELFQRAHDAEGNEKYEATAFVALLRVCAKNKDLCTGSRLHHDIMTRGLLQNCSDALVTMYAKCGELAKAKQLFGIYKSKNVFTWTALIAGYVQIGQGHAALDYFEQMRHMGVSPDAVTFACILKACSIIGASDKGDQIHDEIAKHGLLRNNIVLGNALVNMYVKCGALAKARRVLEELPVRNVVSWNALIAGYAQHGESGQALKCFEGMQREGLSPDVVTFICILKACGSMGAAGKGEKIHDEIAKQGLLETNIMLGNALVDMYAKCGCLAKAQQVLEELPARDVISWNALITGYAQKGEGAQALNCFEGMQRDGLSPTAVTFISILKACGSIGAIDKGEEIHDEIAQKGLLRDNVVLGTALVDMYAKCGALAKARKVLEELPTRNVISWNALIAGYTQKGEGEQALNCFEEMQREGLCPDAVTFISILKACGSVGAADKGEKIHDQIAKQGLLGNDVVLGTALVDMYAKCGALTKAKRVLEELPIRNAISWNALIAGYAERDEGEQALNCFEQMQREGLSPDSVTFICILKACGNLGAADKGEKIHDEIANQGLLANNLVLGTALVDMYAKCGALAKAERVLEELPVRDVVSWNALIAGYVQQGEGVQALNCLEQMQREGLSPDTVTFIYILKACGSTGAIDEGEEIHDEIAKQGLLGNDILLGTALMDMYAKCGALAKARRLLEELRVRDVISWNALIAGYVQQGECEEALNCFEQMQRQGLSPDAMSFIFVLKACGSIGAADKGENVHYEIAKQGLLGKDIVLGTALVDMYAKCGALAKARQVLEELPVRDVVSWNALITGYVQQGEGVQALECFEQMQREGLSPAAVTYMCILKACGSIGAAEKGEKVHDEIAKQGLLGNDVALGTALVDMYAKCGALAKARRVLEGLPVRNVTSWNALIAGSVQQGEGQQAMNCFDQMQREGLSPGAATFSCVLSACSRLGLVADAQMYFVNMSTKYGMKPDLQHYTCMIDLLGRTGHLDKAVGVIEKLPSSDRGVWSALLGACHKWGDVNVGRWAFERAVQVDKSDAAAYVLMANIYTAAGLQEDAENIEAMGVENKAQEKSTESWWVDMIGNTGSFFVGGHKAITSLKLEDLLTKIRAGGYLH